jgi:hypothetical protein
MNNTPPLTPESRAVVNAGHALVEALRDHLSPEHRDKLEMLTTAGASVAMTVQWIDGAVQLRVGVTADDGPASTILALDFKRTDVDAQPH